MIWNSILFYSNLYDNKKWPDKQNISSCVNDLTNVPYLAEERSHVCEGILRYNEGYVFIDSVAGLDWKYLARGQNVQSIIILSYDHFGVENSIWT